MQKNRKPKWIEKTLNDLIFQSDHNFSLFLFFHGFALSAEDSCRYYTFILLWIGLYPVEVWIKRGMEKSVSIEDVFSQKIMEHKLSHDMKNENVIEVL